MIRRAFLCLFVLAMLASRASAQLPADVVIHSKVKIPEKQKSDQLCPVHLVPSKADLPTWSHDGILYRSHTPQCQAEFEQDPGKFAAEASYRRWENNFIDAMSIIWCPVTDEVNPGGGIQWRKLGLVWESCCKFCDEDVADEDFPDALERLKERAQLAYHATGGQYVDGANSPVAGAIRQPEDAEERRLLYVASPGIRNYLEYGGHGILVFDIDQGHKFVKRIPTAGLDEQGRPLNVKGICASAITGRLYVSTLRHLMCLDLVDERILWERTYESGCDRMSMAPDGKVIYLPSLEKDNWYVVDAFTGDVMTRIVPRSGAHNTVYGPDGKHVYLAGLRSPILTVAETNRHTAARTVGPFSDFIRPFTVNGNQTLCFVNVNKLLGFEVGDIMTGKMLHRVEVDGYKKGKVKRHGCPSHGIGMTPDEKELWVCDAANQRLHIFDATVMPPKQIANIALRDEPGWVTFSIDGSLAYPSTGDVIDTRSRKILTGLRDEAGRDVQSEKLLEIDFRGNQPIRAGDQFGIGRILGASRG